jgi:hypothetical protein
MDVIKGDIRINSWYLRWTATGPWWVYHLKYQLSWRHFSNTYASHVFISRCSSGALHFYTYIHIRTTHVLSPKGWLRHLKYSSEIPTFYNNYLAMKNTADVTNKPIAVWSQSVSNLSSINPLVALYDIHLYEFLFNCIAIFLWKMTLANCAICINFQNFKLNFSGLFYLWKHNLSRLHYHHHHQPTTVHC